MKKPNYDSTTACGELMDEVVSFFRVGKSLNAVSRELEINVIKLLITFVSLNYLFVNDTFDFIHICF